MSAPVVLASASPRRREILGTLGVDFEVDAADVDESRRPGEDARRYVARTAAEKAHTVAERRGSARRGEVVLAADTTVVVDGVLLAKPADDEDARRMLELLSGRTHEVSTAVVALAPSRAVERVVTTSVTFRALDRATIDAYLEHGEHRDKAGAYGIQGLAMGFVTHLVGSYTNVVGLPAAETLELLGAAGALERWPRTPARGAR